MVLCVRVHHSIIIAMLIIFIMHCAQAAHAYGVGISWDENPESDVAGYKVYYGTASHTYRNVLDVGPFTAAAIDGLNAGTTYYFAVTAYDTSGNESAASREVQAAIPAASPPLYTLSISKTGNGTGTVTTRPTGSTFPAGTSVTLTATPDAYSTFAGWSGGYSGAAGTTSIVVMNSNVSVSAAFKLRTYTIRASAGRGGSISPSGTATVVAGSYKTYVFTPKWGYCISSVKIDGISIAPIPSYTFNDVKANHTISVSFKRKTR
jgi:hypothetical protein